MYPKFNVFGELQSHPVWKLHTGQADASCHHGGRIKPPPIPLKPTEHYGNIYRGV